MAYDFQYELTLNIMHQTADPEALSRQLNWLTPVRAIRVGDERELRNGTKTRASVSVWRAPLHNPVRLNSESTPLDEAFGEAVSLLVRHTDFVQDLRRNGTVSVEIAIFCETLHSASILTADSLLTCGEAGLDIELSINFRSDQIGGR